MGDYGRIRLHGMRPSEITSSSPPARLRFSTSASRPRFVSKFAPLNRPQPVTTLEDAPGGGRPGERVLPGGLRLRLGHGGRHETGGGGERARVPDDFGDGDGGAGQGTHPGGAGLPSWQAPAAAAGNKRINSRQAPSHDRVGKTWATRE
eukprot:367460-Prorocentrum_minimum.AAC.1